MSEELDKNLEGKSAQEVDDAYKALHLKQVDENDPDLQGSDVQAKENPPTSAKPKKVSKRGAKADPETSKRIAAPIATSKRVQRNQKMRLLRKILLVILSIALLITSTVYIMLLLIEENSMRIYVGQTLEGKSLSLSSTADFAKPTAAITVNGPRVMDNITYSWLFSRYDIDELTLGQEVEGSFSGDNYIAHTFYLKNNGEGEVNYSSAVKMISSFKKLEDCIRVMVVKNGEPTIYAKIAGDGISREYVSASNYGYTTPFFNEEFVMYDQTNTLAVGETDKYTIILWIEGEDPECTNERLGGYVKMNMEFSAI